MESFELIIYVVVSKFSDIKQALETRVHVTVQRVVLQTNDTIFQVLWPIFLLLQRALRHLLFILRLILVVNIHLFDVVMVLINYNRLPLAFPIVHSG